MKLINWHWVAAGVLVALFLGISQIFTSWQRINPEWQQNISFLAYSANVLFSYLIWVALAIVVNWLRQVFPPFTSTQQYWWVWHLSFSCVIGICHLLLDTFLLWAVFGFEFDFLTAYSEKLLRWLPYEILAYWACIGIFSALSGQVVLRASNASNRGEGTATIAVRHQDQKVLVNIHEIECVEAYDNYVFIFTQSQRYLLKRTMHQLESELADKRFLRVHRSTLVNLDKIAETGKANNGQLCLTLKSGKMVAVSRRNRREVNNKIKQSLYRSNHRNNIDIKSGDLGDSSCQPSR